MDNQFVSIGEAKFSIEWNSKYELGIPVIDEQHKKLVALCKEFYEGIVSENADKNAVKAKLTTALKACCDYVKTHFRDEETLLRAASYKNFANHKMQHDEFTRKVLTMAQNFDSTNTLEAIKFARFLYDWIMSHISYTDKQYIPCIIEYLKTKKS